jgi:hypothetical protein
MKSWNQTKRENWTPRMGMATNKILISFQQIKFNPRHARPWEISKLKMSICEEHI